MKCAHHHPSRFIYEQPTASTSVCPVPLASIATMVHPLDRDDGPLVDWNRIGQPRFDRLIEALIRYQHPDGSDVQAINGLGGDGGKDVVVTEPDGRTITYQLKYFPEGSTARRTPAESRSATLARTAGTGDRSSTPSNTTRTSGSWWPRATHRSADGPGSGS